MEKCSICGRDASRKFVEPSIRGEVFETPVHDGCYLEYGLKGYIFEKVKGCRIQGTCSGSSSLVEQLG